MLRLKVEPGDGRSRERAGEMASWKSEQQLVTNGSMIWAFPFGIWPRIFGKRAFGFFSSYRRARELYYPPETGQANKIE